MKSSNQNAINDFGKTVKEGTRISSVLNWDQQEIVD